MKAAILKMIVVLLALIGVHLPHRTVYVCPQGSGGVNIECQPIKL